MSLIQTTPIAGPEARRGADLAGDTSWIVTLTDAEIVDLDRARATARASGRPLAEIDRAEFPLTVLRARLRLRLQFPRRWPFGPAFPSHMGYKPAQDTPILVEAET